MPDMPPLPPGRPEYNRPPRRKTGDRGYDATHQKLRKALLAKFPVGGHQVHGQLRGGALLDELPDGLERRVAEDRQPRPVLNQGVVVGRPVPFKQVVRVVGGCVHVEAEDAVQLVEEGPGRSPVLPGRLAGVVSERTSHVRIYLVVVVLPPFVRRVGGRCSRGRDPPIYLAGGPDELQEPLYRCQMTGCPDISEVVGNQHVVVGGLPRQADPLDERQPVAVLHQGACFLQQLTDLRGVLQGGFEAQAAVEFEQA